MIEDVGGLSSAPGPRPHVRRSTNAYTGCCSSGESWTEGLYIVVPPILVTQEECIVTSSYEAAPPARPTYDSGAPQPAAPQPPPQQHHAAPMPGPHQVSSPFFIWCRTFCVELYICLAHQVQQPQPQQQQQHFQGYQQQPMYHQQGAQYHNPPAPQYHQMVSSQPMDEIFHFQVPSFTLKHVFLAWPWPCSPCPVHSAASSATTPAAALYAAG